MLTENSGPHPGLDIGFALDPDTDRLVMVTGGGKVLSDAQPQRVLETLWAFSE